ncbi:iron uptake porin [Oscillatoria amoena NRMC-F 0135]|uniref:Iron uptake porin n=1 Tax=Geitlerinema calcuttense NRMC-F 0142 TaxID=2922238 RepID=A0ABT7LWB7_9CYAN|nr:iron uptake porin [Geitlerinema calcuttense]MDL5045198.1 iron uptake porin [Oscillatoria amoena NRMC-F 0135]MDL5056318.1 iron uptake porin [Geitlerinema calcuttense NRMC-F 0142]
MKSKLLFKSLLVTPAFLGMALLGAASANASATLLESGTFSLTPETQNLDVAAEAIPAIAAADLVAPVQADTTDANLVQEILAAPLTVAQAAPNANLDQIERYSEPVVGLDSMGQVTSISQLRDVQPTDWAFQALQSLVERYGCIAGYPDGTYRGNRALTRFEFAAGLNACLDRINELIAAATQNILTREDLLVLQRLQEEFAAELATLRGRVDALEARTAELEANQFSTTTKLRGEVIFGLSGAFGDEKANQNVDIDDNVVLAGRARLNFDTSFTGRDRLRTRLQAGNHISFTGATGTNMARLGFDTNTGNDFELDVLTYRFPIGNAITGWIGTTGLAADDVAPTFPTLLNSSGQGSISRFGQRNPVSRLPDGIGGGLSINFSPRLNLAVSYLTDDGNSPLPKDGLFNGAYQARAQLSYTGNTFGIGLSYARAYMPGEDVNLTGSTGSINAIRPFGAVATSANVYGVEGQINLGRRLVLGGWGGWFDTERETGGSRSADVWTWAGSVLFPDLGARGNLGGVVFGMPPKATSGPNRDRDTGYHLEGFYRFRVSNNISITPGVIVLFNPEHNDRNDNIYVGTLRTTFSF